MSKILSYIKLARPKHYIKNLLIFAPLFFAGEFLNGLMLWDGIKLFLAFSALSSAVYIINDIADRKKDSVHPQKKLRPIASGKISVRSAIIYCVLFLILTAILGTQLPVSLTEVFLAYLIINLFYSFWLKNIVIVDIVIVASMYLIRLYAGGELWSIELSHWIVLCTFFLALFIVTAKRRAEFVLIGKTSNTRAVIQEYNKDFLNTILTITTTSCIVTYGLYAVSMKNPYLVYSVFFVTFSMLRYLYLVYKKDHGQYPENSLTDPWIGLGVIGWAIYNGLIFYFF